MHLSSAYTLVLFILFLMNIYILITFNNPIKPSSNKKYSVIIQTLTTQIVNSLFLLEKSGLIEFLNIICT